MKFSLVLQVASTKLAWRWRQTGMEATSNSIVIRHQIAWCWFPAGKDHFTLHRGNMLVLEYCTSALQLLKFKIIGLDLEKNTNICVEMKVS